MRKTLILTLFCWTLQGCGVRAVVVPNLDWLITSRINNSLDLKGEKKKKLQKDVAIFLEEAKPQVRKVKIKLLHINLKNIDIFKETKKMGKAYEDLVLKFTPLYAKYLSEMNEVQLAKLKESNEEANQKILEEIKDISKVILESYERFLGDLSDQQKKLIGMNLEVYTKLREARLEKRKKYQEELYKIFENKDKPKRIKAITDLTLNYNKVEKINPNRTKSFHLVMEVLKLSTPKQQKHFKDQIEDIIPWLDSYLLQNFV